MLISIIIPYYNEPTLIKLLKEVLKVEFQNGYMKEIIVVNDGSTDLTTFELMQHKELLNAIKLVTHEYNKGKGAAIKTGIENSTGDFIIIQDADLEYNPSDIPSVLDPIIKGEYEVSYGSRHFNIKQKLIIWNWLFNSFFHTIIPYLGGRIITLICSILFLSKLTDVLTCYKAFTRTIISDITLKSNGFNLEGELTSKLLKKTRITEVPISYNPRGLKEGKKIRWKDGFKILYNIIKYRFIN